MYRYQIGDVQFSWRSDQFHLERDEFTDLFGVSEDEWNECLPMIRYEYTDFPMDSIESYTLLEKNGTFELYHTEKGYFIVYHWAQCRFGFGYWINDLHENDVVTYYVHPDMKEQLPLAVVRFLSCAGLHSKLLQHGGMVLHASYVDWHGQGILFAAPSQTGKSTQASLWDAYQGAEIINGDRVLLKKKEDTWYSFGYPCCGSSKICKNRTLPLRTIVILEQGTENKVVPLSLSEKIRAIVTGTEFFVWDRYESNLVLDLAEELIKDVEIVKLICREDAQATEVLKKYLEDEDGKNRGLSL